MVQWDLKAELLASLIEVIDYGNRNFIMANSKKGTKPPQPIRVPRPTDSASRALPMETAEPPRHATASEIKAFFGGSVTYIPDESQ